MARIEWRVANESSIDMGAPLSRDLARDPIADTLDGCALDDEDDQELGNIMSGLVDSSCISLDHVHSFKPILASY